VSCQSTLSNLQIIQCWRRGTPGFDRNVLEVGKIQGCNDLVQVDIERAMADDKYFISKSTRL
jgi:hypothetical protein